MQNLKNSKLAGGWYWKKKRVYGLAIGSESLRLNGLKLFLWVNLMFCNTDFFV